MVIPWNKWGIWTQGFCSSGSSLLWCRSYLDGWLQRPKVPGKAKGSSTSARDQENPHRPQAREGYEWWFPKKEMVSGEKNPNQTKRKTCWLQLRRLKITSSQTFISKVVFHVKWKYLLKPYVHICMIQTATTVQHISLNFNKCTLTLSSKSNIVTVTPRLLWSFLLKLQSILFKVIIINETESMLWLQPSSWLLPENWTNQCRSLEIFMWKVRSCNVNMYWYPNMVHAPDFEILNINRGAAEGLIHCQAEEILLSWRISFLYIPSYRDVKRIQIYHPSAE